MTYTKSPSSATKSPGTITQVPVSATSSPTTVTNIPSGEPTLPLDSFTNAPRAAWSNWRRLLTSYTGALQRVRKTTGGDTTTEHDVPYGADNILDTADLAAFVGAQSWAVVTWYDQSGSARDLTQATAANQPRGGTTGTPSLIGTHHAADYDGANDYNARADALGLSGPQNMTAYLECTFDSIPASLSVPFTMGAAFAGQRFGCFATSDTTFAVNIGAANRVFTASSMTSGTHKFVFQLGIGAGVGTARMWQNGTELVELSSANPSNTMSLGTAETVVGSLGGGSSRHDGKISELVVWNALVGAEAAAEL